MQRARDQLVFNGVMESSLASGFEGSSKEGQAANDQIQLCNRNVAVKSFELIGCTAQAAAAASRGSETAEAATPASGCDDKGTANLPLIQGLALKHALPP